MKKRFTDFLKALGGAVESGAAPKKILSKFSGLYPDENIFWNVEGTDNAGFIIPISRYSDIGELYMQSKALINSQRDFLRKIISCGLPNENPKEKFCPVNKDILFGCGSMQELYEHYLTVFEGTMGYKGFCEIFDGYLKEENGALKVKCRNPSDNPPRLYGEAWENRFVLIYDVSDREASIVAALPNINEDEEIDESNLTYRFEAMKMRKKETGWRLSDSSLFVN